MFFLAVQKDQTPREDLLPFVPFCGTFNTIYFSCHEGNVKDVICFGPY